VKKSKAIFFIPPELAPYAASALASRGRKYEEAEHTIKTPFQRDRDRILYSTAFRRLQYKTQVFVNHEGDHFRTRLTHTLETCQISRTVARALALNEDLSEAVALGHDLGHGPFGHAGEWALKEMMAKHGSFEHNVQCLRIVELLEESYPGFRGLNLSFETLEGLKKHPERFYHDRAKRYRTLEAELVDVADEIAYCSHDLDDGLRAGLIDQDQLSEVVLWRQAGKAIEKKHLSLSAGKFTPLAIRSILNLMVMDLIGHSRQMIVEAGIASLSDLQKTRKRLVGFSPDMARWHLDLKKFLMKNLYQHYRVVRMTDKGQRFLKALFSAYMDQPRLLPPDVVRRGEEEGMPRAVCDYVAGMTDRFAVQEYKRLFEPHEIFGSV